jgi:hypothetical protein
MSGENGCWSDPEGMGKQYERIGRESILLYFFNILLGLCLFSMILAYLCSCEIGGNFYYGNKVRRVPGY